MAHPNGSFLDLGELNQWIPIPLNFGPVTQLSRFGLVIDGYKNKEDTYGEYTGHLESQIAAFKIYMGFSDDVIEVVKHILFAKKKVDPDLGVVSPPHVSKIMGLIHKANGFQIAVNTQPFMIPINSKFHPLYDGVDKCKLPLSGYIYKESVGQWFSYFDFCQQIRLDTLYLYILSHPKFLGIHVESPIVTRLVSKVIASCSIFISMRDDLSDAQLQTLENHYNSNILISSDGITNFDTENTTFKMTEEALNKVVNDATTKCDSFKTSDYLTNEPVDHRICMVQWCLLIAGFSCLKASDKLIIDHLLNKLLLVGLKSAQGIIYNVKKIWIQRRIRFNDKVSGRLFKLDDSFNHGFFGERNDTAFPFT
ncbi:unnamed protein product [Ambrosiozyma monospora]|uniref:Unnamed protein product n=1 Tax=Ambrosiozyma monospora TaxID=43982 RepID=A0ACB5TCQ3_AMBMO|nr:unnamed protein product [Ambrosiozyma monospora]